MSEQKAKLVLKKLVVDSGTSVTADDILRTFQKPNDKIPIRKLVELIKQITNNVPRSSHLIEELFSRNPKSKPSYENLVEFLCKISDVIKITTPVDRKSFIKEEIGTPQLCSTKLSNKTSPEDVVSEIREKIVQAASGTLRRSGHGLMSPGNNNISISSSTKQKNQRSYSLWDFNCLDTIPYQQTNASAIPMSSQESIILAELIYSLVGVKGHFIVPDTSCSNIDPVRFKVSDQIHESLKDMIQQIVPLISHYSQVQRFILKASDPNCGLVLQALGAALRVLTYDYYMSITQLEPELEAGNLTLNKLLFFIRPTMSTMEVLADTVTIIGRKDVRGGQVLTVLQDKITSLIGDLRAQKILIHLTQKAAVPYMEILQLWISKGVIIDPQQEFLVEDNELIKREELPEHYSADYWEKRYTIRKERIPRFLDKVSGVILRTGKYLNVIRQCGKNVIFPLTKSLTFSHSDQNYVSFVNKAYDFASRTLLELLMKENDLMGYLQSVKRYFLLQQGDFVAQFMDSCEQELSKNVDQVIPMRLENLLELTLRLSSAKHDPYNEDLKTELLPYDLVTQMSKIMNNEEEFWQANGKIDLTGLECFAFRYEVQWPVSLVLNHIAISKYQMLFRQLFYCKHVERQLCRVWTSNNNAKKFSSNTAELYRSAFTLRQRMMNAIQNIENYMLIEVIEPNWQIFIENMGRVQNVDDVLLVHQDFLDLCLKNCMLTDPSLLRSIIKLCNVCLDFCEFIQKAQRHFNDAELTSMMCSSENSDQSDSEYEFSSHKQNETSLDPSETFSEKVKRFDLEFTGLLIGLLKRITDVAFVNPSDKFINLVHRINFNSYYSDQLENLCAKDSMVTAH